MTYNVFGGTLNLVQLQLRARVLQGEYKFSRTTLPPDPRQSIPSRTGTTGVTPRHHAVLKLGTFRM